jgi:hypothetical protein
VTAEEKRGSERDRFTIYAIPPFSAFADLNRYPLRSTFPPILNSTGRCNGRFHVARFQPRPTTLPLPYKRAPVRPSLPESVHSFLHIMKLLSLSLVLCMPLLALTASVPPPGSPSSSPSFWSALSPSATNPQTQQDMDTVLQRRLGFITASATGVSRIASWYVPTLCLLHI